MQGRIGLWLIGALGGVGTTAAVGLAAVRRGITSTTGLVTELPLFQQIDLAGWDQFVVGGHDVRQGSFPQAAAELQSLSGIFGDNILNQVQDDLEEWSENLRPGIISGVSDAVRRFADWYLTDSDGPKSDAELIDALVADLEAFKQRHGLTHVVVVNVGSTEPIPEPSVVLESRAALEAALAHGESNILPSSSLYGLAALRAGAPYVNFTPSLGISAPALREIADASGVPYAGQDGKTGETLLKTVLAPMFAYRNMRILSWVGHNILGNRDGEVLNDPKSKAGKVKSKDKVIEELLGYRPQTHVSIEYIQSLQDWKTAWDFVHFEGFLGVKMSLQFTWQGADSILAAPLVLDLARLAAWEQAQGSTGNLVHLASFFKSPLDNPTHNLFEQFALLEARLKQAEKVGS